jgi:hypothetical protein
MLRLFDNDEAAGHEAHGELGGIAWTWQSMDGAMVKTPLAQESVGRNPTDRGKKWKQAQHADRRAWRPVVRRRLRGESSRREEVA